MFTYFFLIGVYLLYSILLVSTVLHESALSVHTHLPHYYAVTICAILSSPVVPPHTRALCRHILLLRRLLSRNPAGVLDVYCSLPRSKPNSYLWVADELSVEICIK